MFEQLGDQRLGKFIFIQDDEGVTFVGPPDEIRIP